MLLGAERNELLRQGGQGEFDRAGARCRGGARDGALRSGGRDERARARGAAMVSGLDASSAATAFSSSSSASGKSPVRDLRRAWKRISSTGANSSGSSRGCRSATVFARPILPDSRSKLPSSPPNAPIIPLGTAYGADSFSSGRRPTPRTRSSAAFAPSISAAARARCARTRLSRARISGQSMPSTTVAASARASAASSPSPVSARQPASARIRMARASH